MRRFGRLLVPLLLMCAASPAAEPETRSGMQEIVVLRCENVSALDAPDAELPLFLGQIHRESTPVSPVRALVGPLIGNPYLSGLAEDGWLEGVLAAPSRPGGLAWVWVFPVEQQDEYLAALIRTGMSGSGGSGDVSVLSAMDADGGTVRFYLEWLPGNIAVFGSEREAVRAVREIYDSAGAARGLLGARRGGDFAPDVAIRLYPSRLASWQDAEAGVYWWRSRISGLAGEIIGFLRPEPARARLIQSLAEDFASWPINWSRCDLGVWFGQDGLEWRFGLLGGEGRAGPLSDLSVFRGLPDGAAEAYALALDRDGFASLLASAGRLLLAAAGGVAPAGARDAADSFARMLVQAGPTQAAAAWYPLDPGDPESGSTRLLLTEWERPELLDAAWLVMRPALGAEGPVASALAQIGWRLELEADALVPDGYAITVRPTGKEREEPYCRAGVALLRRGRRLALAWGEVGEDGDSAARTLSRRVGLATQALADETAGPPDVRGAFTLMDAAGATLLFIFRPVRFLQTILGEAAEWRPPSSDEAEPETARAAREMLEYRDAGGAWTGAGVKRGGGWEVNGRLSWQSLAALVAALGVSETVVAPENGENGNAFQTGTLGRGQP